MRTPVRVAIAQLIAVPVGFSAALWLLWVSVCYTHSQPSPFEVLGDVAHEAAKGDEALLILLALCFATLAIAYALSGVYFRQGSRLYLVALLTLAVATGFCTGLRSVWDPHRVVGNVLTALVCLVVFLAVYIRAMRHLAAAVAEVPA